MHILLPTPYGYVHVIKAIHASRLNKWMCNVSLNSKGLKAKNYLVQFLLHISELIFLFSLVRSLSLKLSKEVDQGEARYPRVSQLAGSPSVEWPFTGLEEGGGIESLPFRLMLQDCTAVKTLLLKMKRVLQEVITHSFVKLIAFSINELSGRKGSEKFTGLMCFNMAWLSGIDAEV